MLFKKEQNVLFLIQLFAAIAYSTLYSTLIFYITKGLHLSDITGLHIVASFIAYNYVLHLLGGYIGGTLLSYRSAYAISLLFLVIGCCVISLNTVPAFYWGLSIFLAGAGLVVTCFNCLVTQAFTDDIERETAFISIYAGMNIGLLIGFMMSGYFELIGDYRDLFLLGSAGTFIAFLIWLGHWRRFPDRATTFSKKSRQVQNITMVCGIILMLILVPVLHQILQNAALSHYLVLGLGIFALISIFVLGVKQAQKAARYKVFAYLLLAFGALLFWSLYLMAPMALNLFIARNVDRHLLSFVIAPQWIQTINTLGIILGAPLLIQLLKYCRARKITVSVPLQFSFALLFMGLSFALLTAGIYFANAQGFVNIDWLIMSSLAYSLSELLIAPIGYAMIGRLAPENLQNVMMGTWMMITGLAATLANNFSHFILRNLPSTHPLQTNPSFSHAFILMSGLAIAASAILLFLKPMINKMINSEA